LSPDVLKPVVLSKPSKTGGVEFFLASNLREMLSYHEVNQQVFDDMENSFYVSSIAAERMMTIIALKMLNIDYDHCKL
jgi:hypothetical protein